MRLVILALSCVLLAYQCTSYKTKHYKNGDHDDEDQDDDKREHNPDEDHEAFLGKDDAHMYDENSPEESKEKLGGIFLKVDADSDGQITKDEMVKWLGHTQTRYVEKDADAQLKNDDKNSDGYVTWDEYSNTEYGFLDKNGEPRKDASQEVHHRYDPDVTTKEHYARMVARDERRFKAADVDGDKKLTADEFSSFVHPERADHMKAVATKELLEDMDKDNDGHVSLEEYILDAWPAEERINDPKEPKWVKSERKIFTDTHDKNKDGKLDENEVKEYSFPSDDQNLTEEADHLIKDSDSNGDGKISKDEMLENYEIFIGSQATDFGELLRDPEDL